jgi:hypothetical protein
LNISGTAGDTRRYILSDHGPTHRVQNISKLLERGVHPINVLKQSDDDVKRDAGEILIAAAGALNEALVG